MSDTVKVKINGTEYDFEKGLTVLQAAKSVGINIPYFCWHKNLRISGNCRMCLVEVKPGPPKPMPACGTYIADGMEVETETESVKQVRRSILEFTLLNHPLDCPVCDEAYECKLQDYAYEYGNDTSNFKVFHEKKRMYKRKDLGTVWYEPNRCIQCTRCIRFLRDVAGEFEMERYYRGHNLKVASYKDAFESPFACNVADLCPVGTLEDKKFHFSSRAWDLVRVPTICPSCSIGCNIYVDSFEGSIKRITPRDNDDVNATWICDYGRHNYDFVHENRITKPAVRVEVDLVDSTYEDAFLRTKAGIDELKARYGGEALSIIASPKMTNEELYLAKKLANLLEIGRFGVLAGYNKLPIVPVKSDILPKTLVSDDKTPNSTGARILKIKEDEEDFTFAHEVLASIENGKTKGLILFHEDLANLEAFDVATVRKALALLDFFVVISYQPTHVGSQAQIVFPSLTFAEKHGSFTSHKNRVQRIRPVIKPLDGVLSELEIIIKLGQMYDESFTYETVKDVFEEMTSVESAFGGLKWADIGDLGSELPE